LIDFTTSIVIYELLNKLIDREIKVQDAKSSQQRNKKSKAKVKEEKTRHKVLITGDSHARGMAEELQHNLDKMFQVQGTVKPSCELSSIVNTGIKDITNYVVVVWGGTRDVSRNEAIAGLSHIRKFVEKYNNTNVLVMELPDRCDLSANSCVNAECKSFNRKLRKYMQPFKDASVLEIYCNRSHFTRHGLHLNYKGKEFSARQIHRGIERIFREVISIPIPLNWLDKKRKQETKESKLEECSVIQVKKVVLRYYLQMLSKENMIKKMR
jgi:hypothetical protein